MHLTTEVYECDDDAYFDVIRRTWLILVRLEVMLSLTGTVSFMHLDDVYIMCVHVHVQYATLYCWFYAGLHVHVTLHTCLQTPLKCILTQKLYLHFLFK